MFELLLNKRNVEIQLSLIEDDKDWNKLVRNEATLMGYAGWFLDHRACHHEATADRILQSLEDKDLKHPDFKVNPHSIGSRMCTYPNKLHPKFWHVKKWDPKSKQVKRFWRTCKNF